MLHVGFGEIVITPPLGIEMAGYFEPRLAEGIKDPLYSRALVVSKEKTHVALVVTDLICLLPEDVERLQRFIEERLGIPSSHVLIAASHTHTGPVTVARPGFHRDEQYMVHWAKLTAGAVELAFRNQVPATMGVGRGKLPGVSFNRRFRMKNGYVHTNPGRGNQEILEPAGPVDADVTVLRFDGPEGVPIGVLTHFACHTDTVGGNHFSADWVGVAAEGIRRLMQPFAGQKPLGVLVVNGPCGDINHVDVKATGKGSAWPSYTQKIGLGLAAETVRVAALLQPERVERIGAQAARVQVENMPIDEFACRSEAALADPWVGRMAKRRAEANLRHLEHYRQAPERTMQQVVCVRIGPVLIGSGPGEMFCRFGLDFKNAFPRHVAMMANLANGFVGYVPTAEAYEEGGYEAIAARVKQGSGEFLTETAIQLGRQLLTD